MQSSPQKKKKDFKPILFSTNTQKQAVHDDNKPKNSQSGFVPVHIKLVEINLLKVKTRQEIEGGYKAPVNELSSKKRDHVFIVPKDDIQSSKFLKSNYLPEDNVIEVPVPVNINIPYASFEVLQRIIEAIVEKEKTESATYPLEVTIKNSVEVFTAACLMELEDLAMSIYEASIKSRLSLKLLVGLMLIGLEYNLPKVFMEFYKIFREYWIYKGDWTTEPSPAVKRIIEGKADGTSVGYEYDMFCVYYKDKLEFGFPASVLKRPFDMMRKDLYKEYFKPEQKYFVMNVRRKRTVIETDGVLESNYPHRYYLVNQHTNEIVAYAIRHTEYGDFYLYGDDDTNEMVNGNNFIGQIEANTWGTSFSVYDDGIYEAAYNALPPNICALRTKIANITYQTNIMGETPRHMKIEFIDYAEKKAAQLVPQEPKYDEKNDCYTLNFYGKAKVASARNFILTFPHDQENVIMMQGKASKDLFNLDFRHPLNFAQAFSISLVSIGKKFCVS